MGGYGVGGKGGRVEGREMGAAVGRRGVKGRGQGEGPGGREEGLEGRIGIGE